MPWDWEVHLMPSHINDLGLFSDAWHWITCLTALQDTVASQGRSSSTHITFLTEGSETATFRSYFDDWPQTAVTNLYEEGRGKVAGSSLASKVFESWSGCMLLLPICDAFAMYFFLSSQQYSSSRVLMWRNFLMKTMSRNLLSIAVAF